MKAFFAALLAAALATSAAAAQEAATVRGTTTDFRGRPLRGVSVSAGTVRAITDSIGRYVLRLAPGSISVHATQLGFRAEPRTVEIAAGSETTLDFVLREERVQIDDLVVVRSDTAGWMSRRTGTRREVVVPRTATKAAAATLPELLAGRVAGLLVRPGSGAVASGSRLRLRGASGIAIEGEPLVVVDGVRVIRDASNLSVNVSAGGYPSRLDDFVPDDVERVEVLTGPAAIARYGPEAASGVVEVWTRRGGTGRPRVHAFAEAGVRNDVGEYPTNYARVGRLPNGTRVANCDLYSASVGQCTPVGDSLLTFNPFDAASPFRTGGRRRVGASVEGGAAALAYSAGATAERDLGVLRMDSRQRLDARGSFALRPARGVEVTGSALHLRNELDIPFSSLQGILGVGLLGRVADDQARRIYAEIDTLGVTQEVKRTLATAGIRVSPLRWVSVGANYGIDDVGADEDVHDYFARDPGFPFSRPRTFAESGAARRNAGAFAEAHFALSSALRLATTVGAERLSERRYVRTFSGSDRAFSSSVGRSYHRMDALYARQGVAWRDRLFVTAALRRDEPRYLDPLHSHALSAEWELGRERFFPRPGWLEGLRLRAGYGAAEQLPKELDFERKTEFCSSNRCPVVELPGPQRHGELEGGVDAELLGGRMAVSLTAYRRQTEDVLAIAATSVGDTRPIAGGSVANRGAEARVRVGAPAESRIFWELAGTGAVNRNRYQDDEFPIFVGGSADQQHQPGRPLGSFFGRRIAGLADRDGDGIIECLGQASCEFQLGPEGEYLGSPDPSRLLSLQGRVKVRGVEISALLDHHGGAERLNRDEEFRCGVFSICRAAVDPSAPLAEQARAQALGFGALPVEDATFTRLREAAVTFAIPERWARRFGGRGVELTVAGRNLLTWTGYTGLDPETSGAGPNPFRFTDELTQPLPRTVTTRLDVTF